LTVAADQEYTVQIIVCLLHTFRHISTGSNNDSNAPPFAKISQNQKTVTRITLEVRRHW